MIAEGFRPHRGQKEFIDLVLNTDAKYYTLVSSRQAGKTMLGMNLLLYFAINDARSKVAWISPTYMQVRKVMEELHNAIADSKIAKKVNYSTYEIHLQNGSVIYFRSADNYDALRGYTFDYMCADEASYLKEQGWKSAIQPTVLIRGKKVILMSTPRGRDFFYEMYQLGQSDEHPNYRSFKMTYKGNPFVDMSEIEAAKKTLPDQIFRAEYEGEFIEGESQVFENYSQCMVNHWPKPKGRVFVGCDLGRESDYTCAVFIDEAGQVIEIYRDNQKDWSYMINQIVERARKYDAYIMVEKNSMGTVVVENMQKIYNKVEPFITSNKSKQEIVEGLILDFHEQNVTIPSSTLYPELSNELDVFEMKYSPKSRSVVYAAREPFHDDLILALCISNYNRKQNQSGQYVVMGRLR
jgi:PBSX family phage terminase large subunit